MYRYFRSMLEEALGVVLRAARGAGATVLKVLGLTAPIPLSSPQAVDEDNRTARTAPLVYPGETLVGLPIPAVRSDIEARAREAAAGAVTWSLLEAPPGASIEPSTGRVTWPNVQAPAVGNEVVIRIQSETAGGDVEEQTLTVIVRSEPVNSVYNTGVSL